MKVISSIFAWTINFKLIRKIYFLKLKKNTYGLGDHQMIRISYTDQLIREPHTDQLIYIFLR